MIEVRELKDRYIIIITSEIYNVKQFVLSKEEFRDLYETMREHIGA